MSDRKLRRQVDHAKVDTLGSLALKWSRAFIQLSAGPEFVAVEDVTMLLL
jgi:hypothetical protein